VQSNPTIVLKLLVLLLFGTQTMTTHEFHVRPALEIDEFKKKLVHLSYSRSKDLRDRRMNRSRNASDLYSLRIEAYRTNEDEGLSLLTVWQYPLLFSHLPVDRFAKVLHLRRLPKSWNPCSSDPCQHEHEECRQLMNNPSEYLCLCRANFTGENCSIELVLDATLNTNFVNELRVRTELRVFPRLSPIVWLVSVKKTSMDPSVNGRNRIFVCL
jgi:hypothetical protein